MALPKLKKCTEQIGSQLPYQCQSIPCENHCECYKKLASRLWPVLFTLTYFFSYTYTLLLCWKIKCCCDCCFPQQGRPQCLNFKMSKFTWQVNQSYYCPQFSQAVSSRLHMHIQNPVKYLMWRL